MEELSADISAMHRDAFTVVRWLAFTLANDRVYGAGHKIAQQSARDATQALLAYLELHGDLTFTVSPEGDFQIGGRSAGKPIPSTIALAKRLTELQAQDLSFHKGLTETEVREFIGLLENWRKESNGGFSTLLKAAGITNIHAASFTFQRVSENEVVVGRESQSTDGLDEEAARYIKGMLGDGETMKPAKADALLAVNLDKDEILRELADLVEQFRGSDTAAPAQMMHQVLERLQRVIDALLSVPVHRTQKGRRALRRLIRLVGEDMAARLKELEASGGDLKALYARVKELAEEMAVDGLVAQYLKLRTDMADKEDRLRRQIERARRRGERREEIENRLGEVGLPKEVLKTLIAADDGATPENGDEETDAAQTSGEALAGLMRRLRGEAPAKTARQGLVREIADEMGSVLRKTGERAEGHLAAIERIAREPADRAEGPSRRELLRLMAELGQELRQPLAVITGAVDMLLGGYVGEVSEEQTAILEMAAESAAALDKMVERMVKVAGMPETLHPDAEILAQVRG